MYCTLYLHKNDGVQVHGTLVPEPKIEFRYNPPYRMDIEDPGNSGNREILQEFDDKIIVNGVILHKPFVEKPLETDQHDVVRCCLFWRRKNWTFLIFRKTFSWSEFY